jgi:hypothetical protein
MVHCADSMESIGADRVSRHVHADGRVLVRALLLVLCFAAVARADGSPQRAWWMPHESLESLDRVRRAIAAAAADRFDTILVPIPLAPDASSTTFDGVAAALTEARALNMRVYAWLDVVRASGAGEFPAARDHVLYQHPEWLMVPRALAVGMFRVDLRSPEYVGRLARWTSANSDRVDGLYVSPLHPEAIVYLAARVTSILQQYAVDGVHLDGLRFPDADFDYSRGALDGFREDVRRSLDAAERARIDRIEALDPFAYPEEFPAEWRRFRESRLTALVARLRGAIRAARPEALVTAGVTLDADVALRDQFQDWRGWIEQRHVDAVGRSDRIAGGGPVVFSNEPLPRSPAPVLTTSHNAAADGAQ